MIDQTVRVFNEFYNTDLSVNGDEYEIVLSFFKQYTSSVESAKSFSETLFRVSNITKIPVLELLETFQGQDQMKVSLTMAYYLNTFSDKTVLFGASNILRPVFAVQRNIVQ